MLHQTNVIEFSLLKLAHKLLLLLGNQTWNFYSDTGSDSSALYFWIFFSARSSQVLWTCSIFSRFPLHSLTQYWTFLPITSRRYSSRLSVKHSFSNVNSFYQKINSLFRYGRISKLAVFKCCIASIYLMKSYKKKNFFLFLVKQKQLQLNRCLCL